MKYVLMSTSSVMERHASHLEDIDLMAFSRTGPRILAAEDMTISSDYITTHNLCFCALVRQSRSDLRLNILNAKIGETRTRASSTAGYFLGSIKVPRFSTVPDLCPSCSPPGSRRLEGKKKTQNAHLFSDLAIYCNSVPLHLHLVPLLN